ncbi:putative bifunctional diguanylate cyclase/phosphodiesterase [Idiomarina xiamenensis]|uniref:Signal protein n=1 Tax=Idiomarina xiamenensis 10-D-4 TaxID=740709 RepID=K2L6C8_9GAMM|nr:EAL domain-containing protein [Idiomarina xiamenensis]EKE85345.1 signal protein [Idiomarina xiamenensis 10-D-4]
MHTPLTNYWRKLIILALVIQLLVIIFAERDRQLSIHSHQREALQQLAPLQVRLEGLLTNNLIVLRALAAEVSLDPDISGQRFARLAKELIGKDLHIRHIALAPDLVIKYIYPLAGNEAAIGFDYRRSNSQLAAVQRAIERQAVTVAGPLDLVQGGRALIARVPVFHQQELWGVIAEVIDFQRLLNDTDYRDYQQHYRLSIRGTLDKIINVNDESFDYFNVLGDQQVWQQTYVSAKVSLPDSQWQIGLVPHSGRWWDWQSYTLTLAIGTLLNLLICFFLGKLLFTQKQLRHALATITYQAHTDNVTQLPNRADFIRKLDQRVNEATHTSTSFAVLFLDLDHFKEINDTLGHESGDRLLKELAQRIQQHLSPLDTLARLGGDEFVVLLHHCETDDSAEQCAKTIQKALRQSLTFAGFNLTISASIGIAQFPQHGLSSSTLLKHADLAMYAAKQSGRQTSYVFNEALRHKAERQMQMHSAILEGIKRQQFYVLYQPIINVAEPHAGMAKVEALIRWRHPQYGDISPADFIPLAERTGAILELGEWLLQQVCHDWQQLAANGLPLTIAINRSLREFNDPDKGKHWLTELSKVGMPAQSLVVEITESLLMRKRQRQLKILHDLRQAGVSLAIDDFGTGYSSMNYLREYPIDCIKIDRSFLKDCPQDQRQVSLLEALIKVALSLELNIVAEGVENPEQLALLKQLGCQQAQGFYLAKPMPASELQAFFKTLG